MKLNKSYLIAGGLLLIIILWFLFNALGREKDPIDTTSAPEIASETQIPEVVVQRFTASEHPNKFRLYGKTEPNREVAVKAQTAALVVRTPVTEGTRIKRGTIICRQDVDARSANVEQARANLAAREADYTSTKTLVDKGFASPIQLNSLKAAVDGARAALKQAEIELDNVNMRAPFAGVFDAQLAEVGDYLAPGQPCGQLVELDPLVVEIQFTEMQVGRVDLGQEVDVALATGESLTGKLTLIEAKADASTRTFRSEVQLANPDYALKAGVTADVAITAGQTMAQQVPAKILTLADDGSVGIRYVDSQNIVRFAATETIDEGPGGVWVTGLPDDTRVIVEGQDFVSIGTEVNPRGSIYQGATQ